VFQAEDGIRDRNVTGVQTCALPIYSRLPRALRISPPALSARYCAASSVTLTGSPSAERRAAAWRMPCSTSAAVRLLNSKTVQREIGRASCRERGRRAGGGGEREETE